MIVGLTGGIGCGKSTASALFQELGIVVVDADQVNRDIVQPGTPALTAIHEHFGDDVLQSGELDRRALRNIIFNNPVEQKWLEALLHPLIREEMFSRLNTATSVYALLEAPLLFENDLDKKCHRSILVDLPEDMQLSRASSRDGATSDDIQRIINTQMPRQEKIQRADYILDNSLSVDDLKNQVLRLDQVLRLMAENAEFL
ncbi:dephospho-CoA kinase [Reinekea blandensis]|uniref:Dephospho-CoA kinase n=1 Tax=Reinekea blandensis MED297 TaxID=314283 RepID=A4BKF8_9GAMM|nr:dephospho-CoA kinase [Reinekea blandensis]EAR07405.1 Dephospho-CoA kinase [Reinekea sp. MED297] [Reinekea blandensis MED297]